MLSEVPFLQHKGTKRRRYIIKDGSFERETNLAGVTDEVVSFVETSIGSASVSSLGEHSYLVTCARPDEPSVIIVTMLENSAVSIELDVASAGLETPVKIQAFADGQQIRLLLADACSNIIMLSLDASDLSPIDVDLVSVAVIMEEANLAYSGVELESSMITFLNQTLGVMAVDPYVLSVDLKSRSVSVWSSVAVASSGITNAFFKATDMLLGRPEVPVDIPSVSALTSIQQDDHLYLIFSLHSDASVRRWKLDMSLSNLPTEVVTLVIDLPDPSVWTNHCHNSIVLRSRMYEGAYAVAIHIESNEEGSTLTVVHGVTESISLSSTVRLTIPDGVTSLVDMDLSATKRCHLMAFFQSEQGPLLVTYPPSFTSILGSKPLLTPQEYTLDGWAMQEYNRIATLEVSIDADNTIVQALHCIDTKYMKHLFRPFYPRGDGSVTGPSSSTIYTVITKLVHDYVRDETRSIELECLRAMHEWKRLEGMRTLSTQNDTTDDGIHLDEKDEGFQAQVESHMGRWRKILQTVWHEENRGNTPLLLACLPSGRTALLRSNSITAIVDSKAPTTSSTKEDFLDRIALALLEQIERTKDKSTLLSAIEQKITDDISQACNVAPRSEAVFNELGALGNWTMSANMAIVYNSKNAAIDCVSIQNYLNSMTVAEINSWLCRSPLDSSLPGLTVLASGDANGPPTLLRSQMVGTQIRHSACALFIQAMESVRRLQLGRCLLLTGIQAPMAASRTAFRSYLHALATLWSCGQHVTVPSMAVLQTITSGESPPVKRLTFEGNPRGLLPGNPKQTTVLDTRMIQLCQAMETGVSTTIDVVMINMARSVLESIVVGSEKTSSMGKPYFLLMKELGVLPSPSNESIASDYPRVALRLLLPCMLIPYTDEDCNATLARNEALAECFLFESNERKNHSGAPDLRARASTMFSSSIVEMESDLNMVQSAYDLLVAFREQHHGTSGLLDDSDFMLSGMQLILGGSTGTIKEETRRLCNQQTAHTLFSPLFIEGRANPMETLKKSDCDAITMLARVLLLISNLVSHLSILERHTDRLGRLASSVDGSASMLLEFTQEVISKVEMLLPEQIFKSMPEYIALWSRLFRHAESSHHWEIAYIACTSNPVLELRISNCKRFAKAIVDAGALDELLYHCGKLSGPGAHGLDLFEIAAETLATELNNRYTSALKYPTDYLGCLYTLHASTRNWKRAAQAMDLRHLDALTAFDAAAGSPGINICLAVKDIAGSAVSSANAISLVDDEADRFFVSGEFGPYAPLPILEERELAPKSILKRMRGNDSPLQGALQLPVSRDDRLSRFMTSSDLKWRAVRALAFQKLFSDSSSTAPNTLIFHQKPSLELDRTFIDTLLLHGYLKESFLVAKAMTAVHSDRSAGTKLRGRDVFHDAISHILLTCVAPLVNSDTGASNDMELEINVKYPTLAQLHEAIDYFDNSSNSFCFAFGSKCAHGVFRSARKAAAMELLRQATLAYSTASCPLAVEVAACLLDQSSSLISLPYWLQSFLLGVDDTPGLFAKVSQSSKKGDPSSLIGLYLNRGMYREACDIVSSVLDGESRENHAASRLPEKGDIDFVPYHKIDLLWELAQEAITSGQVFAEEKDQLLASRTKMEQSLAKHFDLMKISQMGLSSARMLH